MVATAGFSLWGLTMLQLSSRGFHVSITMFAWMLLASLMADAQSLGDVARENREKKAAQASTATPPKVITNADLAENPEGYTDPSATEDENAATGPDDGGASRRAAGLRAAKQRAGAQWRQQILAQEGRIANLGARVDRLRAAIRTADPNGSSDGSGLVYTRSQARQIQRLRQMEQQLNQQRNKLEAMQEAARHAGMHTLVYDP
jgi:hypothetical protein